MLDRQCARSRPRRPHPIRARGGARSSDRTLGRSVRPKGDRPCGTGDLGDRRHRVEGVQQKCEPPTLGWALAGFAFIRHNERLLGIIALDLLVVLLGGFTPCLRSSERHFAIRPIGLGPLRSSPAVGALITALWLSHHPLEQRIGFRGGVRAGRRYPSACQPGCRLRCLRLPCSAPRTR
jgi:hypothetical protein